jgi:hypothetical protein
MKKLLLIGLCGFACIRLSAQKIIGEKNQPIIGEKSQGGGQNQNNSDTMVQVIPATIGPYAPQKLLGGDREFDGHGPEVWAWIKLTVVNKKYIDAQVYMHARETVSDWSETEGTWTKRLYTAPNGYEISEILTGKYSEVHYVSNPGVRSFSPAGLTQAVGATHGIDVPFKDDGLVTRWNIVGDTGGADISEDANPHDDTQVAIQLNPMKLKLRKLPQLKPLNSNKIPLRTQTQPAGSKG